MQAQKQIAKSIQSQASQSQPVQSQPKQPVMHVSQQNDPSQNAHMVSPSNDADILKRLQDTIKIMQTNLDEEKERNYKNETKILK